METPIEEQNKPTEAVLAKPNTDVIVVDLRAPTAKPPETSQTRDMFIDDDDYEIPPMA